MTHQEVLAFFVVRRRRDETDDQEDGETNRKTDEESDLEKLDPATVGMPTHKVHDETGEKRNEATEEGNDGSPVEAVPVPVDRRRITDVEIGNNEPSTSNNEVVAEHDTGHGRDKDTETGNDTDERGRSGGDLPWIDGQSKGTKQDSSPFDIDVSRRETSQDHTGRYTIQDDIDRQLSARATETSEENGSANGGRVVVIRLDSTCATSSASTVTAYKFCRMTYQVGRLGSK